MSTYRKGGVKCPRCHKPIWWEGSTPNCDCEPCEACRKMVAPDEMKNFQGWAVCADCLEILQEEGKRIEVADRDWGRKIGILP